MGVQAVFEPSQPRRQGGLPVRPMMTKGGCAGKLPCRSGSALERMRRDFPVTTPVSMHQDRRAEAQSAREGKPMTEMTRTDTRRVAIDLAKNVFQVHVEADSGRLSSSKAVRRERLLALLQSNLPAGTIIAMEACAGAHNCSRQLQLLGYVPIRGLCGEFGVIFPQGPDALRRRIVEAIEDASNEMTPLVRKALQRAHLH